MPKQFGPPYVSWSLTVTECGTHHTPGPLACGPLRQQVVQILHHTLATTFVRKNRKKIEKVTPEQMMGEIHQRLLVHLKMNLTGFPNRAITDRILMTVLEQFVEEIRNEQGRVLKRTTPFWGTSFARFFFADFVTCANFSNL